MPEIVGRVIRRSDAGLDFRPTDATLHNASAPVSYLRVFEVLYQLGEIQPSSGLLQTLVMPLLQCGSTGIDGLFWHVRRAFEI
jgi:hypothetical protein